MPYRFHKLVQTKDVDGAVDYYRDHASEKIAGDFYDELVAVIDHAAQNPTYHHPDSYAAQLRRANLNRFPYHFLYQIRPGYIYIVVVRHDKRHPSYGLRRKY